MQTLLKRIQIAIGAGVAFCMPTLGCDDSIVKSGASHDAGHEGGVTSDAGTYELTELGCSGPEYDGGYYGQCCVDALCYTPTGGGACMTAIDPLLYSTVPGFPPGSGSCACSPTGGDAVAGPFAPNPNNPDEPNGTCCYLVGSIGCTGRPLSVAGEQLIAVIVVRKDWILG